MPRYVLSGYFFNIGNVKPFALDTLSPTEIPSLLALQKANLKSNLTSQEALEQGFLTFPYSSREVSRMMHDMSQPIAKAGEKLAAYALASSKEACLETKLLRPAIELCDTLVFNGKSFREVHYYMMGQICIGEEFRGMGIFDALYDMHRILFSKEYTCVVTEISNLNARSLKAHQRIGFEVIHSYSDGETDWQLVVWDWA